MRLPPGTPIPEVTVTAWIVFAQKGIKKLSKDKESPISEDEVKTLEAEIQKLTDAHIKAIDDLFAKKEKEITTV